MTKPLRMPLGGTWILPFLFLAGCAGKTCMAPTAVTPETMTFKLSAPPCPECPYMFQKKLESIPGVVSVKIMEQNKDITLAYDAAKVNIPQVITAATQSKYKTDDPALKHLQQMAAEKNAACARDASLGEQLNEGDHEMGNQMGQQQGMMGGQQQDMMGGPQQGMMGQQQGMMGGPQQGMMGPQQGMMGPQQGMMGPQQGMMGQQQGMMGQQQGMMGQQQGMMGPQQGMGGPPFGYGQ